MSSNIRLTRLCQYCGKTFEAQKITSKTCSDPCAKKMYKARRKIEKIKEGNTETKRIATLPIEEIKAKEILTVNDTAKLLNCTRQTVHNLIKNATIKALKISARKTLIKHSEIDRLFEDTRLVIANSTPQNPEPKTIPDSKNYEISDCYSTVQIRNNYGVTDKALRRLIVKFNIPNFRSGRYAYVPKDKADRLFKTLKFIKHD